ncbi:hypothetical protein KFE25_006479 [Diacronema lutheri]|uniref:Uncharacterized protein n=1 Tax=Diacronema lutheri TaxID=2081491 RepID=A0A8J5XT40_DIALT|nr:hypothetical protein KFE25_006479 [Diacronema lutheri]
MAVGSASGLRAGQPRGGGARGVALDAAGLPTEDALFDVPRSLLVRVALLPDERARLRNRQLLLALRDPRRAAERSWLRGAPGVRGVAKLLGQVRLERATRVLLLAIDRQSADKGPVELSGLGGGSDGGALALERSVDSGGAHAVDGGSAHELAVAALYERVEPRAPTRQPAGAANDARLPAVARAVDARDEHVSRWEGDTAPPLGVVLAALRSGADTPSVCDALVAAELAPPFARARVDGAWLARDAGDVFGLEDAAARTSRAGELTFETYETSVLLLGAERRARFRARFSVFVARADAARRGHYRGSPGLNARKSPHRLLLFHVGKDGAAGPRYPEEAVRRALYAALCAKRSRVVVDEESVDWMIGVLSGPEFRDPRALAA